MEELYICQALKRDNIDLSICLGCHHNEAHIKDEECIFSLCDKQNFPCGCIPIQKEWD
jgi:hypothetical protein